MPHVFCSRCGNLIPSRQVRDLERRGLVVVEALCPECSESGGTKFETDFRTDE